MAQVRSGYKLRLLPHGFSVTTVLKIMRVWLRTSQMLQTLSRDIMNKVFLGP
jgi:hypothetical protein